MNLINKYTPSEIKLFEVATGVIIENREYTNEELGRYEHQITDYIMSQSTKNGDISRLMNQYNGILNTLIRGQ